MKYLIFVYLSIQIYLTVAGKHRKTLNVNPELPPAAQIKLQPKLIDNKDVLELYQVITPTEKNDLQANPNIKVTQTVIHLKPSVKKPNDKFILVDNQNRAIDDIKESSGIPIPIEVERLQDAQDLPDAAQETPQAPDDAQSGENPGEKENQDPVDRDNQKFLDLGSLAKGNPVHPTAATNALQHAQLHELKSRHTPSAAQKHKKGLTVDGQPLFVEGAQAPKKHDKKTVLVPIKMDKGHYMPPPSPIPALDKAKKTLSQASAIVKTEIPSTQQLFLDSIKRQEIEKKLNYIKEVKEDLLAEKLMERAREKEIGPSKRANEDKDDDDDDDDDDLTFDVNGKTNYKVGLFDPYNPFKI